MKHLIEVVNNCKELNESKLLTDKLLAKLQEKDMTFGEFFTTEEIRDIPIRDLLNNHVDSTQDLIRLVADISVAKYKDKINAHLNFAWSSDEAASGDKH